MTWLKQVFGRQQMYADLSQEIAQHLEQKIAELVAAGTPPAEAERQARREFGNVALIEERGREAWHGPRSKASAPTSGWRCGNFVSSR